MIDEQHQNYGTMTGTPTLVAGAVSDGNQGLQFDGSTNSMSVADSASDSLAVADGGAGGMALELFLKLPSIPGSTKDIIAKAGSYTLSINSAGKLVWKLENGANSVTLTGNQVLSTGVWYHIVAVYNGDYTGATQFGYTSQGAAQLAMPPDYRAGVATGENNLQVAQFTALEKGTVTSVVMDLQRYYDSTGPEWVAAVVYRDSAGLPGARLAQSAPQQLSSGTRAWVTFPLACNFSAGQVWLGFVDGAIGSNDLTSMQIGHETAGGTRKARNSVVTETSHFNLTGLAVDPYGAVVLSDAKKLSLYANYNATGRTGAEGKALIYVNGVLDNSAAYAHGIADSANNIVFASALACSIDEPQIYNKKLTPVQVAQHYSAR